MVILLLGPFMIFQCNLQKAPFCFLLMVSRKNPWLVLAEHLLYARLCVKCMACTNSFNPHDDLGVGSEIVVMSCETLGYMSTSLLTCLISLLTCSLSFSPTSLPLFLQHASHHPASGPLHRLCPLPRMPFLRIPTRDLPPLPSDLCSNVVIPEKASCLKFHLFLTHW